jgi:hypothetical protein
LTLIPVLGWYLCCPASPPYPSQFLPGSLAYSPALVAYAKPEIVAKTVATLRDFFD